MRCTVLVPSLFWSHAAGLALPALETLLAKAEHRSAPALGVEQWLCERFGIASDTELPVAPLMFLADGGEPGSRYWLRADPVHLAFENNQLVLIDSGAFALNAAEADQLSAALSAHFRGDGMDFIASYPTRWYVSFEDGPRIETTPIHDVCGKLIDPRLPRGPDALAWHRLQNEVQMVLHSHPVNAAREERGEPPINSVWFWGLGRLPARLGSHDSHVYADDPLARGLAIAAQLRTERVPAAALALPQDASVNALVVLSALRDPARYGNVQAWQRELQQLEARWFAPLLAMLRKGTVAELTLNSIDAAAATPAIPRSHGSRALSQGILSRTFTVHGADLWKFWRSRRPLAELAGVES
jgi:hypothetical protein